MGAKILSANEHDTLYTDTLGVLTTKGNVLGSYTYIVSKAGYSAQVVRVALSENGNGDVSRVPDDFTDVPLRQLGVSVNGTVLKYNGLTGIESGVPNVKVILTFNDSDLYPSEVSTTTDSMGVYHFTNLPEKVGYTIYVPQATINDVTYASSSTEYTSNLRVGEKRDLPAVYLTLIGRTPELISHNLTGIEVSDTVVFKFSTELIADSIKKYWKVKKGGYLSGNSCEEGTSVLTNASISKDGSTLRIAPTLGSWTKYDQYCISGTGFTYEGEQIEVAKTFIPGNIYEELSNVNKLQATHYYDTYIQLKWKVTGEDIAGYKVYYKTNKINDFREYTSWSGYSVPMDSSICKQADYYYNCPQSKDYGNGYGRYEINYYWYTAFDTDTSTSSTDYYYNGYNDSVSTINIWYTKDTTDADNDDYTFRNRKYLWKVRDTVSCTVSRETYEKFDSPYTSGDCEETFNEMASAPQGSRNLGNDTAFFAYYWYVKKDSAVYDTCEVGYYASYTTCPQYSIYAAYDSTFIFYYKVTYKDTATCTTDSATYAYKSCDHYKTTKVSPDKKTQVYWDKTPTDSVSCTVKYGELFDDIVQCDSLKKARGSYNSTDNNFIWYTEYANIMPTATDSMAFLSTSKIFANESVEDASFIVLPYAQRNGEVVTSSVVKADSVKIKKN